MAFITGNRFLNNYRDLTFMFLDDAILCTGINKIYGLLCLMIFQQLKGGAGILKAKTKIKTNQINNQ